MEISNISSYITDSLDSASQTPINSHRLTAINSQRLINKPSRQILCKIAFEIDEDEQQLLIYEGTTLSTITDELIMKLSLANMLKYGEEISIGRQERQTLENQIKQKIEVIIESCIDSSPKTIKWKNRLTKFIQNQQQVLTKFEETDQRDTARNKSTRYFQYNPVDDQKGQNHDYNNKSTQIIQRARFIEGSLEKKQLSDYSRGIKHRLYDEGRRKFAEKQCLCKMREQSLESQKLSECTFQPNMLKPHIRPSEKSLEKTSQKEDVFNRLYRQAVDKQEKMKAIREQVQQKEVQDANRMNFIPRIDDCSRQIADIKRNAIRGHNTSIYQDLYQKMFRKDKMIVKAQTYNFQPTLCKKSQKIVKKARQNQSKQSTNKINSQENKFLSLYQSFSQKNPSKLSQQRSQIIHRYKFHDKNSTDRSPITPKRNAMEQISLNKNHSYRLKTNIDSSQEKYIGKRVQTAESQLFFNGSKDIKFKHKDGQSLYGERVKKAKENFYFLVGKDQQDLHNISIADKLLYSKRMKTAGSTNRDAKQKSNINPYEFFKMQELSKQNSLPKRHNQSRVSPINAKLTEMSKERKTDLFQIIFQLFDRNFDGQITAESILSSPDIPIHLRSVFYPMADQMRQLKVGLDKQEFIWSLLRIFQKLSTQQHQSFVEWKKILTARS